MGCPSNDRGARDVEFAADKQRAQQIARINRVGPTLMEMDAVTMSSFKFVVGLIHGHTLAPSTSARTLKGSLQKMHAATATRRGLCFEMTSAKKT